MPKGRPIIFVVDDDPAICNLISGLITAENTAVPVEIFQTANAFLARIAPTSRGCVLLDINMPDMSGIDIQRQLTSRGCRLPIVVVSGTADVPSSVTLMRQGAMDLLQKPFSPDQLISAVTAALKLDADRSTQLASKNAASKAISTLSGREEEVMELLVAGKSNKQIGYSLEISERTVEVHRSKIMKKLGMESIAQLVHLYHLAK